MPNPIKTSDLYRHGQELKSLESDLENAQKAYRALLADVQQNAGKLKDGLSGLNPSSSSGRKEIERTATAASKLQKEYLKYNAALDDNAIELAKVRASTREANNIAKLQAKLITSVEGSYNALSAEYSLNKIALNKLTAEERANNKEAKALEEQTAAIFDEMKRLQAATGKTSLNVGNYSEAIKDAISGSFSFEKALSVIAKTPLLGVITLIVSALVGLFQAFKRTEKGAELLARVGGLLEGVFSVIIGLTDRLADGLIKAVNDPRAAFDDFVAFLKAQLVNRINGVIEAVSSLGLALFNLVKGNFKEFRKEAAEAFGGALQSITGLDKEMRQNLIKTVVETADAFGDLRVEQRKLELQTGRLTIALSKANVEAQRLAQIAEDDTKSFRERREASEQVTEALIKAARIEKGIAIARLRILNAEISLRRANGEDVLELTKQQLEAQASLVDAEGALTLAILDQGQKRRKLIQDDEEIRLDVLIDGLNNQLAINKASIDNEEFTLARRAEILRKSREIADRSFAEQQETFQKFTDQRVDLNELVKISDATVLFERIRGLELSEILETRALEAVRDRKDINQEFAESQAKLTQALQLSALADDKFVESVTVGNDGLRQRVSLFSQTSKLGIAAAKENAEELETFLKAFRKRIQPDDKPKSLLEMLGISLSDKALEGLKSAFDFVKGQIDSLFKKQVEIADQRVANSDREVANAQENLNTQLELAQIGETANIELAQRELEAAEENQRKALEQQRKAQQAQQNIETLQQTSSLITMGAKILRDVPFPLNIAAVGTALGAFVAAKLRIASLTRQSFGDGGTIDVGGGTHASGNDTYIGTHGGKRTYAERNEKIAIFSAQAVRKIGSSKLDHMVDMINSSGSPVVDLSTAYSTSEPSITIVDTKGIESRLDKANNRETIVMTANGTAIIKKGSHTQIISGYGN